MARGFHRVSANPRAPSPKRLERPLALPAITRDDVGAWSTTWVSRRTPMGVTTADVTVAVRTIPTPTAVDVMGAATRQPAAGKEE